MVKRPVYYATKVVIHVMDLLILIVQDAITGSFYKMDVVKIIVHLVNIQFMMNNK